VASQLETCIKSATWQVKGGAGWSALGGIFSEAISIPAENMTGAALRLHQAEFLHKK
jgi:hypothetical protein